MMRPGDFARLFREARHELDENKEFFCSISEVLLIFMPILPNALWNRMLVMLLYILLYNVNAHDKYYELKARFIAAPPMHYVRQEASEAEAIEDDASEAEASEAEASEGEASEAEASEGETFEDDASEGEISEADEAEDDDSDSDYEEKKRETKKNK